MHPVPLPWASLTWAVRYMSVCADGLPAAEGIMMKLVGRLMSFGIGHVEVDDGEGSDSDLVERIDKDLPRYVWFDAYSLSFLATGSLAS